jgi:GTP-binding protein
MKILKTEFVKSARDSSGWPREGLPEFAFAGRSNVGKSTLINCLVQRKNLARTSSKPGRTRLINFFRVNDEYMLADLPGYGWAGVSRAERASWKRMVEQYLSGRNELRAVVLIVDLRRGPEKDELDLMAWLEDKDIPVVVVGTKADKLKQNALKDARKELAQALGIPEKEVVIFSGKTRQGREEIWKRLLNTKCFDSQIR